MGALGYPPLLTGDIVHEKVLPQVIGAGIEHAPLVDASHLHNEGAEEIPSPQHEGIDHDALPGAVPYLSQGKLEGAGAGRVLEEDRLSLEVSRGLAV